ncbi:unnamed protein product [Dovyalis caffra]|uniref:Uncharacterized protein n=1 Tax=Dovyalis caffra TaxID=77055 RepID=A0AAV1RM95_9ROSI|nr:unnamed protein product [Dovyalis caffra]
MGKSRQDAASKADCGNSTNARHTRSSLVNPTLPIPTQFPKNMVVKSIIAFRAVLVGGVAIFAKLVGAMKATSGVNLGTASTAVTVG